MRQSVVDQWVMFSEDFESDCDWLYLDVECFATIGIGLLADPFPLVHAMGLDFYWPSNSEPASSTDIENAYRVVKAARHLARGGGKAYRYVRGNEIRATKESLARAAQRKLRLNEAGVRRFFPGWDTFPAPGQALIMSMDWAMGTGRFVSFPHFCARVNAGDWAAVAVLRDDPNSCQMNEQNENESFHRRNCASLELARLAAAAVESGDLESLDVPAVLVRAHEMSAATLARAVS